MEVTYLKVGYHCKLCGITSDCRVVARPKDEDVRKWVEKTTRELYADHQIKSFLCNAQAVDILIPLGETDDPDPWVGKGIPDKTAEEMQALWDKSNGKENT